MNVKMIRWKIMYDSFFLDILSIQPTQLYISALKYQIVNEKLSREKFSHELYNAIPIKQFDDKVIFLDGHTRAAWLINHGIYTIKVYWEKEEYNWDLYRRCINWCKEENINSIDDLKGRIVSSEKYKELWNKRCKIALLEIRRSRKLEQKNIGI